MSYKSAMSTWSTVRGPSNPRARAPLIRPTAAPQPSGTTVATGQPEPLEFAGSWQTVQVPQHQKGSWDAARRDERHASWHRCTGGPRPGGAAGVSAFWRSESAESTPAALALALGDSPTAACSHPDSHPHGNPLWIRLFLCLSHQSQYSHFTESTAPTLPHLPAACCPRGRSLLTSRCQNSPQNVSFHPHKTCPNFQSALISSLSTVIIYPAVNSSPGHEERRKDRTVGCSHPLSLWPSTAI